MLGKEDDDESCEVEEVVLKERRRDEEDQEGVELLDETEEEKKAISGDDHGQVEVVIMKQNRVESERGEPDETQTTNGASPQSLRDSGSPLYVALCLLVFVVLVVSFMQLVSKSPIQSIDDDSDDLPPMMTVDFGLRAKCRECFQGEPDDCGFVPFSFHPFGEKLSHDRDNRVEYKGSG